ncbi:TPA: hypothetical protein DIC40_08005 [Patescibacteria group bacterium]|nr:hypothetical protein P148_SR1C00001G0122 [candidate division SR1 bacterium RAAC1_SR1_1]HCY21728.1 hypothetical protein [Candidatus Gracilibacteria bacterium]
MKTIVNFLIVIAFAISSANAQVIVSFTNPTDFGINNGSITANGAGDGGSYSWNTVPVQYTPTASGLYSGTYTCVITNELGDSTIVSQTISDPAAPYGTLVSSDNDNTFCSGEYVTFSVIGSAPEVEFLVNGIIVTSLDSQKNYTTNNLRNGDIVVAQMKSGMAIGITNSIEVTVNPLPIAFVSHKDVSGCGQNDGSITISGSPGDFYSWSSGMKTYGMESSLTGIGAGVYSCQVINQYGCVETISQVITESAQ